MNVPDRFEAVQVNNEMADVDLNDRLIDRAEEINETCCQIFYSQNAAGHAETGAYIFFGTLIGTGVLAPFAGVAVSHVAIPLLVTEFVFASGFAIHGILAKYDVCGFRK